MLAIAHRLLSQKDFEGPASCPIRSAQRKPLFSDGEGERGPTLIDTPFHLVAISANGSISVAQYGDGSVEEVCSRTAPGGFVAPLTVTVITSDGRGRSAKIEVEAARWEGQGLSGDGGIDHESRRGLGRVDPPTHDYQATRENAMAAFAKSWRRSPSKGGRCSISSCRAAISRCGSDFARPHRMAAAVQRVAASLI
jgi:hypothetical protein